jgi:hypothetical protein
VAKRYRLAMTMATDPIAIVYENVSVLHKNRGVVSASHLPVLYLADPYFDKLGLSNEEIIEEDIRTWLIKSPRD